MTDALDVKWDEPPSRTEDMTHLRRFVEALRAHPGRWARYVDRQGTDVVRPQLVGVLKGLGCEATSSSRGVAVDHPNMCNVWARWPLPDEAP